MHSYQYTEEFGNYQPKRHPRIGLRNHQQSPFFCTCGMGFDAFISMKFAEAGKRGPITYVQKVLEEGLRYEPETYEIEDDEGVHHYKAFWYL